MIGEGRKSTEASDDENIRGKGEVSKRELRKKSV